MSIRSVIQNELTAKYAVLVILGLVLYSNVLHGEFISDDYMWIVNNASLVHQDLGAIYGSFHTRFIAGLTFAFNYRFGGLDPFGYHLFNIFVHVTNTILVYHFVVKTFQTPALKKLFAQGHARRIAFYASLIFLVHPMQTEGVSYICQRFVSLATMFYLGTLWCYVKARLEGKKRFYAAALILMVLGLFTKEMVFTLPLNLVVYEILFLGSSWKSDWKRLSSLLTGGMLLVAVPLVIAHAMFEQKFLMGKHSISLAWPHVLAEINVLARYLRFFIFPWGQSFSYDYPIEGWGGVSTVVSVAVLATLIFYALKNIRKAPFMAYAVAWFFITTSVEAVFAVVYADSHGSLMFDHWAYLSMVGFAVFGAMIIGGSKGSAIPGRCALVAVVLIFSLLCFERNKVWQSEIGLWEDVVKKNSKTSVQYLALGVSYERKGRWQDAVSAYQNGIRKYDRRELTDPNPRMLRAYLSRIYNNLGIIAAQHQHDDLKAMEFFRRAIETDRNNSEAVHNLRFLNGDAAVH